MGDILLEIHSAFDGGKTDIRSYSPSTFAYIGDSIFEIVIRTLVTDKGQRPIDVLNKNAIKIVCAKTQAKMADAVYDLLSVEEQDIYRRGKNTKTHSIAKNASIADYKKATGLEALCGYLFLKNDTKRIVEIIKNALELLEIEI